MNNDLISREALKKALKSNCDLCHDKNTFWCERGSFSHNKRTGNLKAHKNCREKENGVAYNTRFENEAGFTFGSENQNDTTED